MCKLKFPSDCPKSTLALTFEITNATIQGKAYVVETSLNLEERFLFWAKANPQMYHQQVTPLAPPLIRVSIIVFKVFLGKPNIFEQFDILVLLHIDISIGITNGSR